MAALDVSFGMLFIGLVLSTCLYGVNLLQTYNYYRRYPNDRLSLKLTVAVAMLLDTAGIACTAQGVYWYLVTHYGDTTAMAVIAKTLCVESLIMNIVTFIVQCFFANSVYNVSKKNKTVTGLIYFTAFAGFVLGLAMGSEDLIGVYFAALAVRKMWILAGIGLGVVALCDIAITVALCYYFRFYKGGFRDTDTLLDKLIIYTINRGIITATIQTLNMAFFIGMPDNLVWAPFHLVLSRIYIISLLATLNRRDVGKRSGDGILQVSTSQFKSSNGQGGISVSTDTHVDSMAMHSLVLNKSSTGTNSMEKGYMNA
ncbi:hypothetical protein AN958_01275 [Leucoagaricus sp. SymC.cos]|nr:hypothetical protein AN958_01275 [Leucoagaricus sp. SymC.cos]